jgi:hypothetical protein
MVPDDKVVTPERVLFPVRIKIPADVFVRVPAPEITPDKVFVADTANVVVPAKAMLLEMVCATARVMLVLADVVRAPEPRA